MTYLSDLHDSGLPTDWLLERWSMMTLIRRTEEAIAALVESGEVRCPCHLCIGQEAVPAGVSAALDNWDSVWSGHRSHGHYLAKGGPLASLFAETLGKTSGCSGGRGGSMHLTAPEHGFAGSVPIVAAAVSLAAGAAFAYRKRGEAHVAVAYFGDGALEEGSVHEAMNLAALYRLPLVLICENNLYSSHLHWSERRANDALHRAGEFHSIPGERVDGNDVLAVYRAAAGAVCRARAGQGPALIECTTFRWRGHVGASHDLDVGVKRREGLTNWLARDPISPVRQELCLRGVDDLQQRARSIDDQITRALEEARRSPDPLPERVTSRVFTRTESCTERTSAGKACAN